MFYEQLIALCERDGVKPTPLIKSLGFSAGNIKRWENGATVNSDILLAVSKHFKVSVDYLLTGKESTASIQINESLTEIEDKLLSDFRSLSQQGQDYIRQQMFMAREVYKKADIFEANVNAG